MFWTFDHDKVFETQGFTCAPENPGAWSCPKAGYTLWEGTSLFPSKAEAHTAAVIDAETKLEAARQVLETLKAGAL